MLTNTNGITAFLQIEKIEKKACQEGKFSVECLLSTGCGSVWLERSVRDAEAARSNRAIPTRKIKGLCESITPFLRPPLRLPWPLQGKPLRGRPAKSPAAGPSRRKNTFAPSKGSAAEAPRAWRPAALLKKIHALRTAGRRFAAASRSPFFRKNALTAGTGIYTTLK